jgi:hypothetical protein
MRVRVVHAILSIMMMVMGGIVRVLLSAAQAHKTRKRVGA